MDVTNEAAVLINSGVIIATVEFIKKLLKTTVGIELKGELTIVLAILVGAVIGVASGELVLGAVSGAVAVSGVTVAKKIAK